MAQDGVVIRGFFHAGDQFAREFGTNGATGHDLFAANQLAGLLENRPCILRGEQVKRAAHRRVRGDAAGRVRAAADGADDQFVQAHRDARRGVHFLQRAGNPCFSFRNGRARAAGVLNDNRFDRPARGADGGGQFRAVEAFAAERDEQRTADVRVRAKLLQHAERIGVRKAAGKADQMHAAFAKRKDHLARDVMRALDEIDDDEMVADALASVGPREGVKSGVQW